MYRTAPQVVVLDYRLPDLDGLTLCQRLKTHAPAPAVVLHSAFADDALTVAAVVAGADAIVHKNAPGRELAEAIRTVASGGKALPSLGLNHVRAAGEVVDVDDLPILGMLLHGIPRDEIARVVNLDPTMVQLGWLECSAASGPGDRGRLLKRPLRPARPRRPDGRVALR